MKTKMQVKPLLTHHRRDWIETGDDFCPSMIPIPGGVPDFEGMKVSVRKRDLPDYLIEHEPNWHDREGRLYEKAYGWISLVEYHHDNQYFIKFPPSEPPYRVAIWGGDDMGYERYFPTLQEAESAYDELMTGAVTIKDLVALKFFHV